MAEVNCGPLAVFTPGSESVVLYQSHRAFAQVRAQPRIISMRTVTFLVLEGVDKGRVYKDLPVPVTIGREEGNGLRLNDETGESLPRLKCKWKTATSSLRTSIALTARA